MIQMVAPQLVIALVLHKVSIEMRSNSKIGKPKPFAEQTVWWIMVIFAGLVFGAVCHSFYIALSVDGSKQLAEYGDFWGGHLGALSFLAVAMSISLQTLDTRRREKNTEIAAKQLHIHEVVSMHDVITKIGDKLSIKINGKKYQGVSSINRGLELCNKNNTGWQNDIEYDFRATYSYIRFIDGLQLNEINGQNSSYITKEIIDIYKFEADFHKTSKSINKKYEALKIYFNESDEIFKQIDDICLNDGLVINPLIQKVNNAYILKNGDYVEVYIKGDSAIEEGFNVDDKNGADLFFEKIKEIINKIN